MASQALLNPTLYPLLGFPEPQVLSVSHEVFVELGKHLAG